jgi:hypothetical protein
LFPKNFSRISLKRQIRPKIVGNIETDFGRIYFEGFSFIPNYISRFSHFHRATFPLLLSKKTFPLS